MDPEGPGGDRAELEERLRLAEARAEEAREEARRLRRELAGGGPRLEPQLGAPDFRPALRLVRPALALEALGALAFLVLGWHEIMTEDVPPPAATIVLVLGAFFLWPAAILHELGKGTRRGFLIFAVRALVAAVAAVAALVTAVQRLRFGVADASIMVGLALVEGVIVLAAVRAWRQRAHVPAPVPRFDGHGRRIKGDGALRAAAILGTIAALSLAVAGAQLDRRMPFVGLLVGAALLLWSGLAPLRLAASLARDAAGAQPWLIARAIGAGLVIVAMLASSPYAILFTLLSKGLLPWVVVGWPLALAVEITIIVSAIRMTRAARG
jgi:hypothetical protein